MSEGYKVVKDQSLNRYYVHKDSTGKFYTVDCSENGTLRCNCPSFIYRGTCKHLQMVKDAYDIKVTNRHPRKVVDELLPILHKYLDFWSIRWEVVGSYRRGKSTIKDIDILVYQDDMSKWDLMIDEIEEDTQFIRKVRGDQICRYLYRGIQLDINRVEIESDWTPQLLYRTGSKELNIKMRAKAKSLGYILNEHGLYRLSDGLSISNSNWKEEDFFNALQMEYLKPSERDL